MQLLKILKRRHAKRPAHSWWVQPLLKLQNIYRNFKERKNSASSVKCKIS